MRSLCDDTIIHMHSYLTLNDHSSLSTANKYFKNMIDRKELIKKLKNVSFNRLNDLIHIALPWCKYEDVEIDITGDTFDYMDKSTIFTSYIEEISTALLVKSNIACNENSNLKPSRTYLSTMCYSHSLFTEPLPPKEYKIDKIYRCRMIGQIRHTIRKSLLLKALIY